MNWMAGVMIAASVFAADWVDTMPNDALAGWTATGGAWAVEGGVLTGTTDGGDVWLIRDGAVADFEMELGIRLNGEATGAMVFRGHRLPVLPVAEDARPEDVDRTVYGYAVMLDSAVGMAPGTLLDVWKRGVVAEPRRDAQAAFVADDWNHVRIVAKGNTFLVELNGVLAVSGEDVAYSNGALAFMVHSGSVSFRDLSVLDRGRGEGWTPLFNGEDFDGWTEWGTEDWSVSDGTIVGRSGPKKSEGYLATKRTWKDFHVRGAYRILGEGNYGLFYHSTIEYNDEQYPMIAGVQGEVAPGWPSSSGYMYESYLRGWLIEPDMAALAAYAQKPGKWNEIEIKSEGNRRLSWVNGVNVMDFRDAEPNHIEGSFALQLHTGGADGIEWKELYVKEE